MISSAKIVFLIIFLQVCFVSFAQVPQTPQKDTVKEFEIIRGPSMRSIHIDSVTTLQTIAGGAVVKQGTTIFTADSIAINPNTHIVEAFNNVHINQADSVQTYAQYLKYIGTEKTAYLNKDVRLNDKKGTLFTQDLDYNLGTGIGNYHNGGKVVNGTTTITSDDGTYYADTKDIYFKNNVIENDGKNHVTTDSLLYNMLSLGSTFYGNTHIKNKDADIYTTQGTYDSKTGNALFTTRTSVKDSSNRVYIANSMALDDKSGNAQMEGNAVVKDSAGGYIVLANQIFLNKKNNSFLATRKPVLIIKQKNDSIYVAADTIFSGFTTRVASPDFILKKDSVINDSTHIENDTLPTSDTLHRELNVTNDSSSVTASLFDYVKTHRTEKENLVKEKPAVKDTSKAVDLLQLPPPVINDSLRNTSLIDSAKENRIRKERGKMQAIQAALQRKDTIKPLDSLRQHLPMPKDSSKIIANLFDSSKSGKAELQQKKASLLRDSLFIHDSIRPSPFHINSAIVDSIRIPFKNKFADSVYASKLGNQDSLHTNDSSRYFLAFHHVRIFSDSLQSVCDSLFFSAKDSIFRLYYDPIIWGGHSQITGDTIFLYTKNKKADRLYAFEKSMIVNKTTQGFYNQIAGKTINGYFHDGAIDYMRVKGSQAESIYYAQDEDSAYLGMNRATGDVIDLYFKNDDLKKVLYVNDISGKFYPMRQIPQDQKFLKGFIWLDNKRPKNKLELFE